MKESIFEIKMDSDLKEQAEKLYEQMGTTFAEAIRIFAKQSVREQAMPFTMRLTVLEEKRTLGHLSMIFDAKWQNFCVRKIPMPMLV